MTTMLTLLIAAALAFPVPASRPIPVTRPLLGPPPFAQNDLHVASNGSIALAVWDDQRTGNDVTATRINSDGMPLDPTGIVVQADAFVLDVFWTGSSFAVVTLPNPPPQTGVVAIASDTSYGFTITDVDSDGNLSEPKTIAPAGMSYAATSSHGLDAHLLFLPSAGFARFARVVDLQGRVIRPGTPGYNGYATVLAASNGSTFLVLRTNQGTFIAETLDLDGGWGGSADPHLPEMFVPTTLSPDGQGGYVLLGYDQKAGTEVIHLDATGVSTAPPQIIQQGDVVGPPKAYDPVNDLLLTASDDPNTLTGTDVFVQKGSGPRVPLTQSANFQTNAAIAAGGTGFLAAWSENTGTSISVRVRRFAPDATPLGEAQTAYDAPYPDDRYPSFQTPSVTSSGDTYLVTWDRQFARRFDARNARWLDAVPFPLNAMAVASNGSSVIAVTCEAKCPDFPCTMARRVAMSGSAAVSAGTMLGGWDTKTRAAIASDGTNYLAAWNDRLYPSHLVAMRLRADGTPIDDAPLVLGSAFDAICSVAWNGKTYLVTWCDDFDNLYAAYVGSDGTVRALGKITKSQYLRSLKVVAHDGTFVIFSQQWQSEVTAILLDGSTTTFDSAGFLDAASDGTHLMLTYARIDPQAGRVSRVFLDPRIFPSRKRALR